MSYFSTLNVCAPPTAGAIRVDAKRTAAAVKVRLIVRAPLPTRIILQHGTEVLELGAEHKLDAPRRTRSDRTRVDDARNSAEPAADRRRIAGERPDAS